jgi:hypothetical protein
MVADPNKSSRNSLRHPAQRRILEAQSVTRFLFCNGIALALNPAAPPFKRVSMTQDPLKKDRQPRPPASAQATLPVGYRQGIITAITVVLGFTLLFLRYWGFELPGPWTYASIAAAVFLIVSILVQFVALWRSLLLQDDEPNEYNKTLRWFFCSIITLLISLAIAGLDNVHSAKL